MGGQSAQGAVPDVRWSRRNPTTFDVALEVVPERITVRSVFLPRGPSPDPQVVARDPGRDEFERSVSGIPDR
jgi:hypothetical protein